ncbi:MAG: 50S ribosomal protein L4 [Anaerolineae bacterium]
MRAPVLNVHGEAVGETELRPEIFEAPINVPLMHQALVRQLSNARQGTHSTKTRGENNRSKSKWYRQKGTGRARHGSRNAPIFVGGGIAHGPKPRQYRKKMPRKMHRAALRSMLSVLLAEERIIFVDNLELPAPKTKEMVDVLRRLGVEGKVVVLLADRNEDVYRATRNLPDVRMLRASYLNVRDGLGADYVIIPLDSLAVIEAILGKTEATQPAPAQAADGLS